MGGGGGFQRYVPSSCPATATTQNAQLTQLLPLPLPPPLPRLRRLQLRRVVEDIMANAPATMVLASATLAGWERLPAWWRGRGTEPCKRAIITQVGARLLVACRLR